MPIIQEGLNITTTDYDTESIQEDLANSEGSSDYLTWMDLTWSVFSMFFWSPPSQIPNIFQLIILLPLRIWFWFIILKNIVVNIIPFT